MSRSSLKPNSKSRRNSSWAIIAALLVHYSEPEVTDADVDARLDEVRERKAEYVNEEPRPLAVGDYALLSLESISGAAEKISQDEIMVKLGDEATMPAFTENLTRRIAR